MPPSRAGRPDRHALLGATVLVIGGLGLGLLLAAQFQTPVPRLSAPAPDSRRDIATTTIRQLEAEQAELKKTIGELRVHIASTQQQMTAQRGSLGELSAQLHQQRLLAGMIGLRGPGLRIVLDDSAAKTVPASDDPSLYLVHEYQLRDAVNLLWRAGAEAIAINDERVVNSTSIYCVGSTILINDTRLSPPYEIIAIGDPAALEGVLAAPDALKTLKARVKAYGVQFTHSRAPEVVIPAYRGSVTIRHTTLAVPAARSELAPRAGD
ncbi:MAG: DUF881 domain-containing protein [Chloroflexi bacterium]|nr:DUF881 domain-containing protein [Chloroflexota bacterium]